LPRVDADLSRDYTPKPLQWEQWTRRLRSGHVVLFLYLPHRCHQGICSRGLRAGEKHKA
jgi:hypothetical protein